VHCEATLVAPGLAEAHRAVATLEPALRAHAERPAPEVVRRRLQAQSRGLERQRERAAAMQAEADARMGQALPPERDPVELAHWLAPLRETAATLPSWAACVAWAAGGALALLLWWWW
jgi:hypothetical protein